MPVHSVGSTLVSEHWTSHEPDTPLPRFRGGEHGEAPGLCQDMRLDLKGHLCSWPEVIADDGDPVGPGGSEPWEW